MQYTRSTSFQTHNTTALTATATIIPPATSNWFVMGLESMNVIQIGLPVFDEAPVVCGSHPNSVVAPRHAADGTIMTLWVDRAGPSHDLFL